MTDATVAHLSHDLCGGAIHLPGDRGYDDARRAWNLTADLRPAAIGHPGSTEELAELVRAARAAGLRIAVQGTGHAAAALDDLSDALLIRTSGMRGVDVDAASGLVRVGAGALWGDAVDAAAAQGLSVLHGSSPDVGVIGYSLGGGLGWYARALGLQSDAITAATVVTSSGDILSVDDDSFPSLMWGLRGGGGNFVIVADLEFRAHAFTTAYAGMLVWDWDHAEAVLRRWGPWAESAPDAVTTSFRILQIPPLPDVPELFRGRQLVVIDGAILTDDPQAERLLAPLRGLHPDLDTFSRVPTSSLTRLHMDPEGPTPAVTDGILLRELTDEAINTFLDMTGPGSESPLTFAELRQLGGAVARRSTRPSALSHLDAAFGLVLGGAAPLPELGAAIRLVSDQVIAAMRPWAGGLYLNAAESRVDPSKAFPAAVWEQLRELRSVWDPEGVLVASHQIPSA